MSTYLQSNKVNAASFKFGKIFMLKNERLEQWRAVSKGSDLHRIITQMYGSHHPNGTFQLLVQLLTTVLVYTQSFAGI